MRNWFILFLFCILMVPKSFAISNKPKKKEILGSHCGLYCLYVAFKVNQTEINFKKILQPEYISSYKGSTLAELKKAAIDHNLYADTIGNLSDSELKTANKPIILHVKSSPQSKEYDHYILFLGDKDGKAKIFDPPNPVELKPYHELAPIWDGKGLIVSAEPINLSNIFAPARTRFLIFAAIAIVMIFLIRASGKYIVQKMGKMNWQTKFGFSVIQAVCLAGVALFGGMIFHFTDDAGFLAHAGATESVIKANIEDFIPKINADDVKNLISSGAVIIDARQSADFDAGHIEKAINIPTTLCQKGREGKLSGIDKNAQIVIYCQSKGCPYAANVAAKLYDDGFKNISIYKNGWVEWQERFGEKNENK